MLAVVATLTLATTTVAAPDKPPHGNQAIFHGHRRGDQSWQWNYRVWMPAVWQRIAWCESGTRPPADPDWTHDSGTYQGAMGFWYGSWDRFKPVAWWPDNAADASPWMQYRTALEIHARYGFTGWGCYRNAWVRG